MKNIFFKSFLVIVLMITMVVTSILNVNAASETIQIGPSSQTKSYIAGVTFPYKVTTDGKYLYCLDTKKKTAENIQATLVKDSRVINGGLLYILKNGYPNKSITGDKDKDYYITQTAIWWYLDMTTGSSNLGEAFKSTGNDFYSLRKVVKQLAYDGYSHRNDEIEQSTARIKLGSTSTDMTLKNGYYISEDIKATEAVNISSYEVTLTNIPNGTVVTTNGVDNVYSKPFTVKATDSFKVKVPVSGISTTELAIKVSAAATGSAYYMAYEYRPNDSSMQNVALLEKASSSAAASMTLNISASRVSVLKIDSTTKKALAGAVLALKDESGKEITRWTSTNNAHIIRNLRNGNYTIEELAAPTGYIRNTNITKFTMSDKVKDLNINIENAPKKVVVNITKIDQETNAALAGAVLVVRKSDGTEVVRFTTTTAPYILTDLANGTYTVEEISAPAGYILNTEKLSFTVDDNHLSHQVNFVNAKAVVVPDTAEIPSILIAILGIIFTGLGLGFVYKNAKQA